MERRRDDDDRGRGRERDDDRGGRDRDRGGDDRRDRGRERDDDRGGRGRERDDDRGSRGRSSFEYKERDPALSREREQSNSKFDQYLSSKIKLWKPADGDNCIRLLPPTWDGAKHWGVDVWVHYSVGADRQTYLCPEKMGKGKCPICEERRAFSKDASLESEKDKKYLKDLDAKQRVLVYLVDRDHERDGVQGWAMPQGLDSDIVKITKDKRTGEVLAIDHPTKGYDITFEKSGSREHTKYQAPAVARSSSDLGKDDWLEFAQDNPLPDQLIFYDYDKIAREFGGVIGDRGDDKSKERDRGGDRDRGRERERGGDDRRDSRDRDERGGRDRDGGRNEKVTLTWESVHEMTGRELEDLIESERLSIDPKKSKSDDDLADWICEDLKLEKARERERSSRDDDRGRDRERDRGSDDERLNKLRERVRD